MSDYIQANREAWNRWTEVHKQSRFYDLEGFRRGASSLKSLEIEELGDVDGKSLLHLQCHMGFDTLSWARLGARAVGVDLADDAIGVATSLAEELGLPARFIAADVYDIGKILDEKFDVVFTSYGVLWWLPDLDKWARLVREALEPGGIFYIVEFHPLLYMLDDSGHELRDTYFYDGDPWKEESSESYADPEVKVDTTSYGWQHGIGEILTALIGAGLEIEWVREHPYSPYDCFPYTYETAPGRFEIKGLEGKIPFLFSVRAKAPS